MHITDTPTKIDSWHIGYIVFKVGGHMAIDKPIDGNDNGEKQREAKTIFSLVALEIIGLYGESSISRLSAHDFFRYLPYKCQGLYWY